MTQEQILEGNKLIAEFIGANKRSVNFYKLEDEILAHEADLKYHKINFKDWNNLMKVVEKIRSLGYKVMINDWSSIYRQKGAFTRESICTFSGKSMLENTYNCVVEFIKQHDDGR